MSDRLNRHQDAMDLARGTGVNLLGNLGKISRPISFIFAGRVFGAEALGLFMLAWSVVDLLSKLAIFGLDISIVKFITRRQLEENPEKAYRTLGHALSISLVASLSVTTVVLIISPWIAGTFFHKPDLVRPLRILVFAIPFLTVSTVLMGATKALKIMRFDVYVRNIIEPFGFLIGVTLSSLIWTGGSALPLAQNLSLLAGAVASCFYFRRFFSFRNCLRAISPGAFRSDIARIALPVSLYNLLNLFMSRMDVLLLGYFLPAGRVGIYSIAREVALVVKDFRQACDPIFAPVISEQLHGGEIQRLGETTALVTRWTLAISLPFLGILILSGEYILGIFGPAFVEGTTAAIILAFAHLINSIFGFSELVLLMAGRPYLNLINTVWVVLISGVSGILLIPHYGIVGPPLAAVLAFGTVNLIRLIQVHQVLGIHPFRYVLIKPIFAFGVASVISLLLNLWLSTVISIHDGICAGLFLGLYILIRWSLKLEPEEQQLLRRLWQRLKL